ncbi:CAP domain-containing protein [Streptomonospora nanhaiensis]|uniref:CAP domain-containing protein n=1 Tax=Streptomonospora nanhaiensis TaxID=1323731 RepID=UPI001C99BD34|nr:CAP domain-containing protein [Streptomonospora nanhaiensis]MBX9387088.1 CAP domain-containing protein [Streptomonospora nanhaiensis]
MARGQRRRGRRRGGTRARRRAEAHRGGTWRRTLVGSLTAVPVGLGLAAALIVAAGGPGAAPFAEESGTGAAGVPDDALPPAADDFFDDVGGSGGAPEEAGSAAGAGAGAGGTGGGAAANGGVTSGGTVIEVSPQPSEPAPPEAGPGPEDPGQDGPDAPGAPPSLAAAVVEIANDERADAGCAPLRVDPRLTAASQNHADDMAERDYMAHETPEGVGPQERAEEAGYSAWSGENVAAGYSSAEAVMDGWMNSPGHRANILDCGNTEIGVGVTDGMWAQNFGAE